MTNAFIVSERKAEIKRVGESSSMVTPTGSIGKISAATVGQVPVAIPPGIMINPRLNSENYQMWKGSMTPILHGYDLMKFIEGVSPPISIADAHGNVVKNPEFKKWWRIDQQVSGFLHQTISESVLPCKSKARSSLDAWEKLENTFIDWNQVRVMEFQWRFHNMKKGVDSREAPSSKLGRDWRVMATVAS
ncbi:uncharacterized protein LOC144712489 [Wolffia australiana]